MTTKPVLQFSPYAWRKLLFLRDISQNEVCALGISDKNSPLHVVDLVVPKQPVSEVSCNLDMDSVADIYADFAEQNKPVEEFGRVWLHTHPGTSSQPSGTDERTFATNYGNCEWGVMFILARNGSTYSRMSLSAFDLQLLTDVVINWNTAFPASCEKEWAAEYTKAVSQKPVYVPLIQPHSAHPTKLTSRKKEKLLLAYDPNLEWWESEDEAQEEAYDLWDDLDYTRPEIQAELE